MFGDRHFFAGAALDARSMEEKGPGEGPRSSAFASKSACPDWELFFKIMSTPWTKELGWDTPVEGLCFSVRAMNCLERAGVVTLRDLSRKRVAELRAVKGLGSKTLREIQEVLADLGKTLVP
jgi:DNA-directed RNA polymerase alpha subunit